MTLHIKSHRQGFGNGYTAITRRDETAEGAGIALGVLKLAAGDTLVFRPADETAWLLMSGEITVGVGGKSHRLARGSLFDESPSCVHVPPGTEVSFAAESDVELTVYACENANSFAPRVYRPEDVPDEHRGKGQVGDRCLRFVRTIFDGNIADRNAGLVLGEVVTLPGGWSSYPPHHHDQPEIYHYRFTEPQGYGHAELGEQVLMVKQFDTVKILDGVDHAQCAAPGYGMYYSWVIRHLPDMPYTVPEFSPEHRWTMAPDAPFWRPRSQADE